MNQITRTRIIGTLRLDSFEMPPSWHPSRRLPIAQGMGPSRAPNRLLRHPPLLCQGW